ncbi:hypothetical protein TBLA_0C06330 [Henningerozyma blattae CBS 6284]|uniref:U3 small nucleolar RNA-associated protein 14 n=1 Tax=Henningerozyma blattae (strain ATCC 34711 / CBS 6284 / DSM 70876 / NBRC 10599 / NRRL Y-10934 / UCD 77-7) TaxID=1071380 RepID=I2H226_HENB6|nr:hypothetical protein TBLA_0C06330 [Tetrapisispora blattae CBS 6284]CCH60428.1 hypothetical protein TBLA_0C06330 [Tetrapisispora blattae CBS 6284]
MAKTKRKGNSRKKSAKRVLNALEIAEKELNGFNSSSDEESYNKSGSGRRKNVVNLLKRVQRGESRDDDDDVSDDSFVDEELDSDDALGSDDDYDVLNSKFSQTIRDMTKKSGKEYVPDYIDEEEGYTSIDEDDLMPLSAVWDMEDKTKDDDISDSDTEQSKNQLKLDDNLSESSSNEESSSGEESASDGESTSESGDESNSDYDPFDEISEDEEDVALNTITNDLIKDTNQNISRKLDTYGGGEESEFVLPTKHVSSSIGNSGKLNLADMMNAIDDKKASAEAAFVTNNPQTSQVVSVPLPQRIQKRHEREAAYEISKKEVHKWKDIVDQNRDADHLDFSKLNNKTKQKEASVFTRESKHNKNELESKVDELLEKSNLAEDIENSKFEELSEAKMSSEDIIKRRNEVRLMRELMFREERKARRIKKIKSKAYHRIKKKELLKNKAFAGIDEFEDEEDAEIARAKERMTLKHRANSKWAKDMVKHGMSNDKETREEIEEMLRQGDRLKDKILGYNDNEDRDNRDINDLEDEYGDEDQEAADAKTRNIGKSGIMNMQFMKNAESREREENKIAIDRLRRFENGEDVEQFFGNDEENGKNRAVNVELNKGRRIYTPGNLDSKREMDELEKEVMEEENIDRARTLEGRLTKKIQGTKVEKKLFEENLTKTTEEDESDKESVKKNDGNNTTKHDNREENDVNPWLVDSDDEDSHIKRSSKVEVIDKNSSKLVKSGNKIAKAMNKNPMKRTHDDDDELLDVMNNKLELNRDKDSTSYMFQQQDVVAEAFAGDDVVTTFEQEKAEIADDDDDKEEDVTLPGWGSWAGAGANPKKKRKFTKIVKGVVEKDKRKDKNLKNVIINEKFNKHSVKYQSSSVPFPYENREQYERSLRMPLGQEWTSRSSHQKLIKPRIMVKPGEVIDPLKAPFKG